MPIVVPIGTSATVGTGITTYSGIIGTLERWLNRYDITSDIPIWIALLEARLNRELRVPDMEEIVVLSLVDGAADHPADFLEARHLYLNSDTDREITPSSLSEFREVYPTMTGPNPVLYAIAKGQVTVAPSSNDDVTLHYYKKITPLSSDNESNWLLASHPDVYLYGALMMGEAFLWNDERVPMWKAAWDEAIDSLKHHGVKKRHGGGPLSARIPNAA